MTGETRPQIACAPLLAYGFIALPVAFAGFPIYVNGPDFYASNYGLSLGLLGAVLLFLRFIDAVQDPILGALSDRYYKHRTEILLVAALVLAGGFTLLFHPLFEGGLLIWFGVLTFLVSTAYSVLVINVTALGSLWSVERHERTRISAVREGFALVGLLLAVALPPIFAQAFATSTAFLMVSALLAGLLVIALVLFTGWYKAHQGAVETPGETNAAGFWHGLKEMSRENRWFYLVYGVSMLSSSIPAVLVLFFVRDYLGGEVYTGLFLAVYFLTGAVGMAGWLRISQALDDKLYAWLAAMLLAVATFGWALLLQPGDLLGFGLICFFSGLAFGGELALPPSILADHIIRQQARGAGGRFYGLLTLFTKLSLALSTALVFPLLEGAGFSPGQQNAPASLKALLYAYAGLPLLIKLIAILLLLFYLSRFHNKGVKLAR